jgi:hypothetical protein
MELVGIQSADIPDGAARLAGSAETMEGGTETSKSAERTLECFMVYVF